MQIFARAIILVMLFCCCCCKHPGDNISGLIMAQTGLLSSGYHACFKFVSIPVHGISNTTD